MARIGGWGDFDGAGIVGPMITYLLPILIGATGGRMVYGIRGGVVGAIATMGVIAGTDIPMFMGAMIMGPLGEDHMALLTQIAQTFLNKDEVARLREAATAAEIQAVLSSAG